MEDREQTHLDGVAESRPTCASSRTSYAAPHNSRRCNPRPYRTGASLVIPRRQPCPIADLENRQASAPAPAPRPLFGTMASAGAKEYVRSRDLPGLISLWPAEIANVSTEGSLLILRKLQRALRAERRRGSEGHWSYDLNRHLGLWSAYKAEAAQLKMPERLRRTARVAPGRGNARA